MCKTAFANQIIPEQKDTIGFFMTVTLTDRKETASEQPAVTTTRLTFILGALTSFAPFATDMYLASFPVLAKYFSTGLGQIQLGLSLFFLGLAGGQLIYGPMVDRFGRKKPLLVGVSVFILASLALTVAPNIESFIALRLLQAIGGCSGMIISRAIINDLFAPREVARVLSLMMLVQGLGPITAPILGGYILVFAGWKAIFVFLALFGTACFLATLFGLPETLPRHRRLNHNASDIFRTFSGLLRQRDFIVPALTGSLAFGGLFAYISGSPFVFMELHGVSQEHYGWLFGANACGMIMAAQINRFLLIRFSPLQVLVAALTINVSAALAMLLMAGNLSFPMLVALLWIALSILPLIGANATALGMAAGRKYGGSASAIIGVLQFSLASIVSALVGVFHNGTSYPMICIILACGLSAGSVLFFGKKPA